MASHSFLPIISLILLLLISLPSAFTENTMYEVSSTGSDMVECGSSLIPLAACAPFVQGTLPAPTHLCCDNLSDLYDQEPNCLCVLLDDTSSFPINRTLALQLPGLCELKLNTSTCPGLAPSPSPASSITQVSYGTSSKSSTAVPPMVAMPPKSNLGFGLHQNAGQNLKISQDVFAVFLLIQVFIWF